MAFPSIHFIFLFLPVVLLLYYLLPFKAWKHSVLIFASLVFFAWVEFSRLPVLIGSVLLNYLTGILLSVLIEKERTALARIVIWLGVAANISLLAFYKYLPLYLNTINPNLAASQALAGIVMPMGISYFTFSAISYLFDVYHKALPAERNLLVFSAYFVMFPKLVQGPITRLKEIQSDLSKPVFSGENLASGARRFIIGLGKKVILADSLAVVVTRVFDGNLKLIGADLAWYGLLAYTLQIYLDFSAYTDMAIGIGRMLGIKLPENFNYPYISRSISDFWRRWHMSLTAWFRTYLFIPLEFARRREKVFRQPSNIFIVFLLTGLWHGASWNFIAWGAYYGAILAFEAWRGNKLLKKSPQLFQHFYTLSLVMAGWLLFKFSDLYTLKLFVKTLVGRNGWLGLENLRSMNLLMFLPFVLLGILVSLPAVESACQKLLKVSPKFRLLLDVCLLMLLAISVAFVLANGFKVFIYEQF